MPPLKMTSSILVVQQSPSTWSAKTWGRKNLKPGDEILISAMEHHSNIVPWQMIAEEKAATTKSCQ